MQSRRFNLVMVIAVLAGFGIILLINLAALVGIMPFKYISPNDVNGIAIERQEQLYTLNFEQQTQLIDIFNRSSPVPMAEMKTRKSDYPIEVSKIIIYRFNAPNIEVKPITYVTHGPNEIALIFEAKEWDSKSFLQESSPEEFQKLIQKTYDQ